MPTLNIVDFSCIKLANIDLKPLTVVIGPQSSGKSLISKLFYFFSDIPHIQYSAAERGFSIKPFLKFIAKNFTTTFPHNTWGDGPFCINYEAGQMSFKIERKKRGNNFVNDVEVSCSSFFDKQYSSLFKAHQSVNRKNSAADDDFSIISFTPESFDLRRSSMRALISTLGSDYIESQFFIPAGRSFYSNLGKAVAMFEFGSQLDEVTKRFGRKFTSLLDGQPRFFFPEKPKKRTNDFIKSQTGIMESMIGGKLKLASSEKYVETKDGRIIPFHLMSSGQQELLPLLLALKSYTMENAEDNDPSTDLLYIEEPEAHLFPSTQAAVIRHIVSVANFIPQRARFFITTHSPYVLSTLNTFVKAFNVALQKNDRLVEISKIVPKNFWVSPANISVYGLESGILKSIKDQSGLIDASYLDQISEELSSEFFELLEVEVSGD